MPIDFTPSPEQEAIRASARSFARAELAGVKAAIDAVASPEGRFYATEPFYRAMVAAGFIKTLIPREYGGTELSTLDAAQAAEELAYVDVNVPTTFLATGLGLQSLLRFGTSDQKRRFLPDFVADGMRLAALAWTDAGGGANWDSPDPDAGMRTFARREGDHWVINGEKTYTTNGSGWDGKGAHLFSVVCRTDPTKGPKESMAVILVPGATPGVEVAGFIDTLGHRATMTPRMRFDNVRVPLDNLVGAPGDGLDIVETAFSWTAALIGAAAVGVMQAAFDTAFEFAKREKKLGTHPVIEHQNVGYMLADLKMKIEAARYLTWKACHQVDTSGGMAHEIAVMTKVYCSELAVQALYDSMRLVGIDSYSDAYPLAGLMQDALAFPLYDGGNMGVRRRQLHRMFQDPGYDPMASAEGRLPIIGNRPPPALH